jgi:hypothetical protein
MKKCICILDCRSNIWRDVPSNTFFFTKDEWYYYKESAIFSKEYTVYHYSDSSDTVPYSSYPDNDFKSHFMKVDEYRNSKISNILE